MSTTLTQDDLMAIKQLIDSSIDERVPNIIDDRVPKIIDKQVPGIINKHIPGIVQPMLDRLEKRLVHKLDQLTLYVGQFSLETTNSFIDLEKRLSEKIDVLDDKLTLTTEITDTNRVEITKVKRKLGLA